MKLFLIYTNMNFYINIIIPKIYTAISNIKLKNIVKLLAPRGQHYNIVYKVSDITL